MTPALSCFIVVLYVCWKCVFMRVFVQEHPKDASALCLASLFQAFPALRCVCAPAMNRALCSEHTAEPSWWIHDLNAESKRLKKIKKKTNMMMSATGTLTPLWWKWEVPRHNRCFCCKLQRDAASLLVYQHIWPWSCSRFHPGKGNFSYFCSGARLSLQSWL